MQLFSFRFILKLVLYYFDCIVHWKEKKHYTKIEIQGVFAFILCLTLVLQLPESGDVGEDRT